jgi:cytidyltransferase-like protein
MAIAIITEFNPFHNGHIYLLEKTKKLFPFDEIIIIMSGKYVQRGEISIATFSERKKIALKYGASKVIELPFKYATQAAHIFAQGAIEIIHKNKIDKMIFGSESNDVNRLIKIARSIYENEDKYNLLLKKNLKKGFSFPKSANNALIEITNEDISLPNDILGFEYVKAIIRNKYNITPYSIKRTIPFHSTKVKSKYASASYIRELIMTNKDASMYTPMRIDIKEIDLIEDHYYEFQEIVNTLTAEELSKIQLISEGMENLFKKHINAKSYDEFVSLCNSKRYTSSRIKRVMLYVLLQIKK